MGAQDSANTHGQNWGGDAGHSATGAGGDGGTAALGLAAYSAARIPRALATLVVVRSLLTAMAITLPIPCGVFMPVLVVGCAVGRLYGYYVALLLGSEWWSQGSAQRAVLAVRSPSPPHTKPFPSRQKNKSAQYHVDGFRCCVQGSYAVAGGAAFSAGVTRAVSTAVFVFEMTGQLHQLIPVLCASLSLSSP